MKKKWIKILITLFICAMLAFGFTACVNVKNDSSSSSSVSSSGSASAEQSSSDSSQDSSVGNWGDSSSEQTHTHSYASLTVNATCTEKGVTIYTCDCGSIYMEEIPALNHDEKTHKAQAPTCTEIGWEEYVTCERADCDYSTYEEIPATGEHTWDNGTITTAPTCTEKGVKTFTCTVCETATYTEDVEALNHDEKTHEAQAPTCTEIGWEEYVTCERADCDYSTYEEIPATGEHTWDNGTITTEPTCTEKGVTTYTCTVCETATYTEDVEALNHDEKTHEAQAPTCTEIGWEEYVTCERVDCDYSTYEEIPATGEHTWDNGTITTEPTCTEKGVTTYTCTVCETATYTEDVEALNHDEKTHEAQEPTCTEIGWEEYVTCERVDCDYSTYTEISALNHDKVQHDAQAPTCTEKGWEAHETCTRCDYSTCVEISALGHDYIYHEAKSATCIEIGWNAYETCKRDGCSYNSYYEIPITEEHTATEVEIITEPTALQNGCEKYVCIHCGNTFIEDIIPTDFSINQDNNGMVPFKGGHYQGGKMLDFIIPAVFQYDGIWYRVTGIEENAFNYDGRVETIVIPDSITYIDPAAFAIFNREGLTDIVVGDDNKNFISVNGSLYTKDMKTLLLYAYGKTETTFTIPSGVTTIADYAFYCSKLTEIVIPTTVTSIGDSAFEYCYSLMRVEIGGGVTSIGDYAFYNCNNLTSVQIPNSVTSIGDYAFYNCNGLTGVWIPNSVISIGKSAFKECDGLTNVEISNGVMSIGDHAFEACDRLTSVRIPASVTSIGNGAFCHCNILASITVSENNTAYKSIGGNLYSKDGTTLIQYAVGKKATTFTIPASVTIVSSKAFYSCYSLTEIVIPDSVTSIGDSAFMYCSKLAVVRITNIAIWCNISFGDAYSNPLYFAKKLYLNNELVTELTIPDGVTSIGDYAFYSCESLTKIVIPDSVTNIGSSAFAYCDSLTSVFIPDSVTSIGSSAFAYCDSLTSVVIGDSVTSIGPYAFSGCSGLTSVEMGDSVTSIGHSAFYNCNSLRSVVIPDGVTSIGSSTFAYCDSLTSVFIPDSVTSIGSSAFYGCSSLVNITFMNTSTWYRTSSSTNWENKTGGTSTNVTTPSTNATYFTDTYDNYYWYKL